MNKKTTTAIKIGFVEEFHGETDLILRELKDAEMNFEHAVVSGEDSFVQMLESFLPDVVLSPYSLKDTNAVKLLKLARSSGNDTPFILLAFDLSEDIAIDLLADGIEDYVLRSTLKRLPVAIRKALQRYKTKLELQLSEGRLRASETALRNMVRNAPIAVAMFDKQMDYLVVSDVWLKHEKQTEDIIGQNHYSVVPEIPEKWKLIHQEVLQGKTKESEREKMLRSDGSTQIIRWKMNPWYTSEGTVGGAVLFIEDISEIISTNEQLEKTAASLAVAQSIAKVGSWKIHEETNKVEWSDEMFVIHGIKKQSLSVDLIRNLTHPEDLHLFDGAFSALMKGEATDIVYRIIQPSTNKTRSVRGLGRIVKDQNGEIQDVSGVVQDITESKAVEEELRHNEQLIREMAENIEEVFWVTDKTGKELIYMSPLYEKVYGRPLEELYEDGGAWAKNIHPEDHERVYRSFHENGHLGKYNEEYRLVHDDGTTKWVHARAFPIKDGSGNVVRLAGVTVEVTEKKNSQEQIELLSLVASETINGVLIHGPDGSVIWSNKGFETITGFRSDEILGKEPWSVLSGPETDRKLIEQTYAKVNQGEAFTSDNLLIHKDGHQVWITVTFTPVMDNNGRLTKIVSVGTDITRLKELEQQERPPQD